MSAADLLRDPDFATLPPERQAALRQEALGHIIIDPDFAELQKQDPVKAVNFLMQVNSSNRAGLPTAKEEALQEPGEGQGFFRSLVDPGVLLEPSGAVAGFATGAYIGAKGAQVAGQKAAQALKPAAAAKVAEAEAPPVMATEVGGVVSEAPKPTAQLPAVLGKQEPVHLIQMSPGMAGSAPSIERSFMADIPTMVRLRQMPDEELAQSKMKLLEAYQRAVDQGLIQQTGKKAMDIQSFRQHVGAELDRRGITTPPDFEVGRRTYAEKGIREPLPFNPEIEDSIQTFLRPKDITPPPTPKRVTPTAQPAEVFEPIVKQELEENVKQAVLQDINKLAQTEASQKGQRLFKQVAEALESGEIDVPSLPGILERSGMSRQEFVKQWAEAQTTHGKGLYKLSVLKKQLMKQAEQDPDLAAALDTLEKEVPDFTYFGKITKGWEGIKAGYQAVDNIRRGSLVVQAATTARNIESQFARYATEVLDHALQAGMKGEDPTKALELTASLFRNMKPGSRAALTKILDEFPVEQAKLLGTPIGESALGSKYTKVLNVFNIAQEQLFRHATFDASVRTGLKKAGIEVEVALANPQSIPEDIIKTGVREAMEVTFAATPQPNTLGKGITDAYRAIPMFTTINPFPRFWANSLQFLSDYNPAGAIRLMGKDAEGKFLAANPEKRAEILSKAAIGTGFLATAMAVRQSDIGGAKWYELKIGDQTIDTRPFAPFSTYLFMADVIDMVGDMGADVIKDGRSLKQAMIDNKRYTTSDWVQGILSINRIAGTGLVAVDFIKEGSLDRKMDLLRDLAAQYIGGFTVPFRTLKDLAAGVSSESGVGKLIQSGEEAKVRDVREDILGPAKANIPGVSQTLPEAVSPLTATPPTSEHPIMRQTTGVSMKKENLVANEMSRLGVEFSQIAPKTGDPESDREVSRRMGPMVESGIGKVIQSEPYKKIANPQIKRVVLTAALMLAKREATRVMKEERPELEKRLQVEEVPQDVEDLVNSLLGINMKALVK